MINFGDVPLGTVLPIPFDSNAAAGESNTISNFAVTDVEIYAGTSMVQRASDNGVTLLATTGVDLDGIVGCHGVSFDTGDNSDAGFMAVGTRYRVVVASITVDGKTVNFHACIFRLVPAENVAGVPKVDVDRWLGTQVLALSDGSYVRADVRAWLDNGVAATAPGVPNVNVVTMAASVLTATAIATDAFDADAVKADAVTKFAGGVISNTSNKIQTGTTG